MIEETGAERVAGAYRADHFRRRRRHDEGIVGRLHEAAVLAQCHDDGLQAEPLRQRRTEGFELFRQPEQSGEMPEFLFVEFDEIGETERIFDDFPIVEILTQVDVIEAFAPELPGQFPERPA